MKTIKLFSLAAVAAVTFAACSSNAVESSDQKKVAEATVESVKYTVNPATSEVSWHGKKLAYGHSGVITLKSGELALEGDKLVSGNFEIDMTSVTETGNPDTEKATQLAGHLMNEDFFDAEKFPVSKFEITSAEKKEDGTYTINGNLTIKGITKNIAFPATIAQNGNEVTANAEFTINRIDWDIRYGSGVSGAVADQAISDDIDFKVSLKASK